MLTPASLFHPARGQRAEPRQLMPRARMDVTICERATTSAMMLLESMLVLWSYEIRMSNTGRCVVLG